MNNLKDKLLDNIIVKIVGIICIGVLLIIGGAIGGVIVDVRYHMLRKYITYKYYKE